MEYLCRSHRCGVPDVKWRTFCLFGVFLSAVLGSLSVKYCSVLLEPEDSKLT